MYYVYILQGTRYYVGYTNDLRRRIKQHQDGKTHSTSRYGELQCIGYFECQSKSEATQLETTIKKSHNIKRWIKHRDFVRYKQ